MTHSPNHPAVAYQAAAPKPRHAFTGFCSLCGETCLRLDDGDRFTDYYDEDPVWDEDGEHYD